MDFDTWTPSKLDPLRVKRLVLGYVVGAIAVVLTGALIFLSSPNASAKEDEEPEIEAQLAKEPEPEPEPEPPPPEPVEKPKPKPKIQIPVEIPKEAPKEAEPVQQQKDEPDPFEEKPAPVETAKPAVVEAPKAPPPKVVVDKPKGPTRVLEDDTPPEPISQTKPEYPSSAKAAGIEGVVVVKYVVSETGAVIDAKVIKGPPELTAVCLAAVKTWRFTPAKDVTGKVKAVTRIARFPFKLKT
jgi:periplasmic protein TonB